MEKTDFKFDFTMLIADFASAWLIVSGIFNVAFQDLSHEFLKFDFKATVLYLAFLVTFFIVITITQIKLKKQSLSSYLLFGSLLFFALMLCVKLNDMNVFIVMCAVIFLFLHCLFEKCKPCNLFKDISEKNLIAAVVTVTLIVLISVETISVLRYLTFSAPNYDFGIFCNMFYNMKKTGLPITTCERDRVLSHFAVHISPVFYILLPLYSVFSSPLTLAVIQPVIIFSGIIPVYLLANHFKITQNAKLFIVMAFCLFAPLSTGSFYDIHENCFLVPFLLWMFYFFEKDKKMLYFLFAVVTLSVKEDAFIYLVFFSLYVMLSRKKFVLGSSTLLLSLTYFLVASFLLKKYGLGVMDSRYGNLSDGSGLIGAAESIITNPGFAIKQLLETRDGDMGKIYYLASLFLPLVFLPFVTHDLTRLMLILPVFINILTKYPYQYQIDYQYTFGICTFLIYLTLLNLTDLPKEKQFKMSFGSVVISFLLFSMLVFPFEAKYIDKYNRTKDSISKINEAIEFIPDDATVTASTFFLPQLAKRDIIFEDEYHEETDTEYFVLDLRKTDAEKRAEKYIDAGYILVYKVPNLIEIYQSK